MYMISEDGIILVELRNGARIENAHCAIKTGLGDDNWHTTGGIVKADSAFFVNNRRSVAFLSYTNHNAGGGIANNQSYFYRCLFTVNDDNLFALNNSAFIDHVTMWEVRGIEFKGCTFNNLTTGNTGDRHHGIYSLDAGFTVDDHCGVNYLIDCECPENYSTPCTFSGFTTAVEVVNAEEQQPVYINRAQFENNATGIRIDVNNYATVIRCDFNLQNAPSHSTDICGLYLSGCTGYKVEENHFHRSSVSHNNVIGIRVNASGPTANTIYRNEFDTLNYGIYVTGTNGSTTCGLQMLCGEFSGNVRDIYIADNHTLVSPFQGTLQASAGNTFNGTQTYNIQNTNSQNIVYFYTGKPVSSNIYYPSLITSNVLPYLSNSANSCTSTLCDGILPNLAGFQSDMNAYTSATSNQSPADGTDGGVAPTWSEAVRELSETYYTAVRTLMADTVLDLNELEQWHTVAQPIADPYSLTETRFMMGYSEPFVADADDAELANYADFHAMKVALRNNFNDNVDNADNNISPDINWYALTPAQIAQLQTIAERNAGRASVMAKGVLCFFFGICYDDELLVDDNADNNDNNGGAETRSAKAVQQNGETHLNVYPNPTDDILYVELSGAGIKSVGLYDLQGRAVTGVFNTPQPGIAAINVRNVPAGVYVLHVTDGNGKEYRQKVVRR